MNVRASALADLIFSCTYLFFFLAFVLIQIAAGLLSEILVLIFTTSATISLKCFGSFLKIGTVDTNSAKSPSVKTMLPR
jgi:hypothetical protein